MNRSKQLRILARGLAVLAKGLKAEATTRLSGNTWRAIVKSLTEIRKRTEDQDSLKELDKLQQAAMSKNSNRFKKLLDRMDTEVSDEVDDAVVTAITEHMSGNDRDQDALLMFGY